LDGVEITKTCDPWAVHSAKSTLPAQGLPHLTPLQQQLYDLIVREKQLTPAESRLMLKENNHRLRFLADSEIEALLKACEDLKTSTPHLRPIVETALLTGMRREEMLSLKWEQIRNGFIYWTETKSGKARQIPINDQLAEVFREVRRGNELKSA